MSIEDLVDDKELVVVMTEAQYVKAVPAASFKTQSRGGRGVSGGKLKADDIVRHVIFTTAHAHLLFFSNLGKVYRLRALDIPERERTAKGMPIVNLLPLQPGETIQAIIDTRDFAGERFLFFATRQGTVKKTAFDAYDSSRRDGLIAINLRDGDQLVRVIETGGGDDIFMVTRKGMTIRFSEDEVRPMGRTAAGVRGIRLRSGDEVVSVDVARDDTAILMVTEAGFGKRTQLEHYNRQGRGGQGVIGIKLTNRKGQVVAAFMVGIDDEIVAVSSGGVTIRMPVREISSQGRAATGVRVMNLDDGQTVASVAAILANDAELTADRPPWRRPSPDGPSSTVDTRGGSDARPDDRSASAARPHHSPPPRLRWRSCSRSAVGRLAGDLVDAARARTAADAVGPRRRPRWPGRGRRSSRPGTTRSVIGWSRSGRDVVVTVRVGHAVATARATGGDLAGSGR